ncbi:MAG TPA: hypothetical protein VGP15_12710, partial [Burkholderiales bacterium]|nr:hypothetical protein [Burkholderiales bacterium]
MELLRMLTGIDVVYIPYKSVGLVVTDLLAGRMERRSPMFRRTWRTLGTASCARSPPRRPLHHRRE